MTIEEKAKAYDEVVNKLKGFIAQGVDPLITMADVRDFFPELKESEDESIRKRLIELLKKNGEQHYAKEIAWLEKQGEPYPILSNSLNIGKVEQKPAEWSKEDEKMLDGIVGILESWDCSHTTLDGALPSIVPNYVRWLTSIRLQNHWKPTEEQMEALSKAICFIFDDNNETKNTLRKMYNELRTL